MTIFQIRQATTGAVLWTGGAENEQQALDAMAREAGYADFASIPESVRGTDTRVDRLNLG
ncbi:hypothetical protein [Methylobacterium nodulans]|uniref:Uncharacterized protein n=1 Tax=Methylobacterium nodulans (strain LMG 21967 / CNCM I-2342 / ORS 2060) TaxID=460265 RepID=B8IQ04_METNO|nr:hypothetical protein [Methylobacterium nodulans]ACL56654.1 conserved hypothetical protein [Methylobacterium nodulans ORS 2060]